MAEHYCQEHSCKFYLNEKDGRSWYSHKIRGSDPARYCNEPEEGAIAKPETSSNEMSKEDWTEKDKIRSSSIELQNAYTGVPALVHLLKTYPDDQLALAAYNYAMSKLGNWSSMGSPPQPPQSTPSPTEEETKGKTLSKKSLKVLADTALAQGYEPSNVTAIIVNEFHKAKASELTDKEAIELQETLLEGKFKQDADTNDPPDLSF